MFPCLEKHRNQCLFCLEIPIAPFSMNQLEMEYQETQWDYSWSSNFPNLPPYKCIWTIITKILSQQVNYRFQ